MGGLTFYRQFIKGKAFSMASIISMTYFIKRVDFHFDFEHFNRCEGAVRYKVLDLLTFTTPKYPVLL